MICPVCLVKLFYQSYPKVMFVYLWYHLVWVPLNFIFGHSLKEELKILPCVVRFKNYSILTSSYIYDDKFLALPKENYCYGTETWLLHSLRVYQNDQLMNDVWYYYLKLLVITITVSCLSNYLFISSFSKKIEFFKIISVEIFAHSVMHEILKKLIFKKRFIENE